MSDVWQILKQGGPVMVPLLLLSILLYERCFRLLFGLIRFRRRLLAKMGRVRLDLRRVREIQDLLRERFSHDNVVIGSLVGAAPLLGLLGTVMGMISTFNTMADRSGPKGGGGLAEGISMALITTETGLAIAIPAVVVVYYANRQLQRAMRTLVELENQKPSDP